MSFDCKWFSFEDWQIKDWCYFYSGCREIVDVRQELKLMEAWCDANPKRAARKKDWKRFANNWLKAEYRKKLTSQKEAHVGTGPVASGVREDVLERWRAKQREREGVR